MPTENPKISGYVPKVVYDRFKQFQEERGLSMSQAVIEILVEHFGIDLTNNSTKEFTGVLPDRVGRLEQDLADLKQSYVYLSNKVDFIQSTSEPQKDVLNNLPRSSSNGKPIVEPLNNLSSELPDESEKELPITRYLIEQENKLSDSGELSSELKSKPLDLSPHQLEIIDSEQQQVSDLPSNPLSGLEIKINYPTLALRLEATEGYLKNKKSTSSPEQFTEWSTKKDPDKIGWQPVKEGKKVYYCPVIGLSDEQKLICRNGLLKTKPL